MSKLITFVGIIIQLSSIQCQFQPPPQERLEFGKVLEAIDGLLYSYDKLPTAIADGLGLSPGDPATGDAVMSEFLNSECLNHTAIFLRAVKDDELWAKRMLDSYGRRPSGFMQGKVSWLGDWEACRGVKAIVVNGATPESEPRDLYGGKYCRIDYQLKTPFTYGFNAQTMYSIGVCLPDSCSSEDARKLAELASLASPYLNSTMNTTLPLPASVICQEVLPWDTRAIVVLAVCSMFIVLMIAATLYDVIYIQWLLKIHPTKTGESRPVNGHQNEAFNSIGSSLNKPRTNVSTVGSDKNGTYSRQYSSESSSSNTMAESEAQLEVKYEPSRVIKLLLAFSVFTNATKLLGTNQPNKNLSMVNGIRFLSISYVILGHSYQIMSPFAENPVQFSQDMWTEITNMTINSASLSVDTFFTLSGFLLAYFALKELEKCKGARNFKWGVFYFHRIWKLTPPYMLTLMTYVALNKYFGSGPLWRPEGMETDDCKTWWTNLLYANNLVQSDNNCFWWSWYLANDMQFYILSPLMLIPLFHLPIAGGIVCLLFLLTSVISGFVVSMRYELSLTFPYLENFQDYMKYYYVKPWCRVGPYAVGMFTGYLLYRWKSTLKIPRVTNVCAWLVAATVSVLLLWGPYSEDGTNPFSVELSALYNATSRSIWGACIAWVIVACATGNGGPINHILSWPGFIPLGRLSYCAYLVHPIIIYTYGMSVNELIHMNQFIVTYQFLGHICMSFMAAFVISMAFEAPMIALEKVMFERPRRAETDSKNTSQQRLPKPELEGKILRQNTTLQRARTHNRSVYIVDKDGAIC